MTDAERIEQLEEQRRVAWEALATTMDRLRGVSKRARLFSPSLAAEIEGAVDALHAGLGGTPRNGGPVLFGGDK